MEHTFRQLHTGNFIYKASAFVKKHTVLTIALALALITSCIVPPDKEYIGYFDFKTLTCLFCTLAVVCALKNIGFFSATARKIVQITGNTRSAVIALAYITFIGSMIIANDMALITFLPLGYFVLSSTGKEKYMAFTFIMQNISANLGGMLTPFGNPQNLYLYSKFNIPTTEFFSIMFPPFALSVTLITGCCLFVKKEPLTINKSESAKPDTKKTVLYASLFVYSIAIVFRALPYWTGLILIPAVLIFADRKALKDVDYALLFTFAAFFVFAGNMARINVVNDLLSSLLAKNTLVVSAFSCQIISNVPSAILLSQFTQNYRELLLGVNIGGTGTLIASLASLITLSEYTRLSGGKTRQYICMFSAFNFGFLIILLVFCSVI